VGYNGFGRIDGQAGAPGGVAGADGSAGGALGGAPGVLRLFNSALGGQGGWLIGFAVISGLGLLIVTRLRRADERTGWLIAVGGAFLTTAAAFTFARGIFHPYYVSQLAPLTAALVGAGAAYLTQPSEAARILGPSGVVAGVAGELLVIHAAGVSPAWVAPVLVLVGLAAAATLGARVSEPVRATAMALAFIALLTAPAIWAVSTLSHASAGAFPVGGPTPAASGPGVAVRITGRRLIGSGARARVLSDGAPGRFAGSAPVASARGAPTGARSPRNVSLGGGMFGGDNLLLMRALRYVRAHGGGPLAVSSQSRAAVAIIAMHANVVGLGGFTGRESDVDLDWLARIIRAGRLRWVLPGGDTPVLVGDNRVGARAAMAALQRACRPLPSYRLFDCRGRGAALAALDR
jgi:hypothetical protein